MSKPRINPYDVFPLRNLPTESEQWGRTVENRVMNLEKEALSLDQSVHGGNRSTAAQLANIAEQLTAISETQRELGQQQLQLSSTVKRLNETSQTHVYPTILSTNSSDWLGEYVIPRPSWADAAVISSSYVTTGGSTTREVLLPVYVSNEPITSVGGVIGTTSNGFFTGSNWYIHEPTTPVAVTLTPSQSVRIRPYRTVMASGTGNLSVQIIYSVTFSTIL